MYQETKMQSYRHKWLQTGNIYKHFVGTLTNNEQQQWALVQYVGLKHISNIRVYLELPWNQNKQWRRFHTASNACDRKIEKKA